MGYVYQIQSLNGSKVMDISKVMDKVEMGGGGTPPNI